MGNIAHRPIGVFRLRGLVKASTRLLKTFIVPHPLYVLIFLFASSLLGQGDLETEPVLLHNWSTKDGLPHNRVREVEQTSDGFLWVANDSGVARFDGLNFKSFGLREGLLAPIVLTVHEDGDGALWVGTLGGGLSMLKNEKIVRTYTTNDGLPSNWVSKIGVNGDGEFTVLTRNGVAVLRDGRFHALPAPIRGKKSAIRLVSDFKGQRWIHRYNRILWKETGDRWLIAQDGPRKSVTVSLDQEKRIWACGKDVLWKQLDDGWQAIPLPEKYQGTSHSSACDVDGTVWIASHRLGLCGYRDGRFFEPDFGPEFDLRVVEKVQSKGGEIWLTSAKGLFRLSRRDFRVDRVDDRLSNPAANNIGGMLSAGPDEFLLATQGGGFYRWKSGRATLLSREPKLGQGIYGNDILLASDGTLWLGSGRGLYCVPPGQEAERFKLPIQGGEPIWALTEVQGAIWVGGGWGSLCRISGGKAELIEFKDGREPIKIIQEDHAGRLWIGTRGNGLYSYKEGEWKRYGREEGLLSEVIRTLCVDAENRLWVGSDGGGLSLMQGEHFVCVTSAEGLPSDTISQIFFDATGRLWLGTHEGMAVLDHDDLAKIYSGEPDVLHPLVLNEADGLPSAEFTIVPPVKCADGAVAFATIDGFVRIIPGAIKKNSDRLSTFVESVVADGVLYSLESGVVTLPPGTKRVEIEYSGFLFDGLKSVEFRNRLAGIEEDWATVGARRGAEYRNLGPGSYRFEVEASNGNGLWSEAAATVNIVIKPYLWQRLWFQVLVFLAGVAVVVGFVRTREKRKTRRALEAMQRRQAVDQERARIARDLHDDVGASLTQMGLQSQLAERNLEQRPERATAHLEEIFTTARDTARSLDEIVWAVNPGNDVFDNFVLFLSSLVQDFADVAGLRARFEFPAEDLPGLPVASMTRHHVYLAFKETLHNVVKHAKASELTFKVELEGDHCRLSLKDDGRSMEGSTRLLGGKGLENLEQRLRSINGIYVCKRVPGEGTRVVLDFPLE